MTLNGWLQIALMLVLVVATARPLGIYMASVLRRQAHVPRSGAAPGRAAASISLAGVDEKREQDWLGYTMALLVFNAAGFVLLYAILRLQHVLPLNPQGFDPMSPHLAFNTAASFVTNTNWQSYGGESTLSYFSQMVGLTVQNFVSAATGFAVAVAVARAFARSKAVDGRQFLGRSDARHALRAAAALDRARAGAGRVRHAAEPQRLCRCDDARRRQADARAGPGRQPGRHQAARHQRRRLLQRQRRAPLRESEHLDQPPSDLGHLLARPGTRRHLRPHDRQGARRLGAAVRDGAVPRRRLRRSPTGRKRPAIR